MDEKINGSGQSYNAQDQELIHQLIQSRMQQKAPMEFEDLEGYLLPPRTQFPMLKKPTVSIKYREININMACVRLFEGVQHVLPIIHPVKHRLAFVPCAEEESSSVEWARLKDGVWVNKTITSLEFVEKIFALMNWDRNARYKTVGRVSNSTSGLILVFDLEEAVAFDPKVSEYVDQQTGEIKRHRTIYYPDYYKDCIGKSYNDYAGARQLNLFEYLEDYVGKTYSDAHSSAVKEPREESVPLSVDKQADSKKLIRAEGEIQ